MPKDSDPLLGQLLLQVLLIGLNAVFACAEIAIISINDNKLSRLAATGDKKAQRLLSLTQQPARFLSTIQVGITLAGFLGSAFAADNFASRLVEVFGSIGFLSTIPISVLRSVSVFIITIILSYFTLIFGELVPKRIAMKRAEPLALAMSGLIYTISKIFSPIVSFLTFSTNAILRLLGIDPDSDDDQVTEEEIRMMIDVGSEKGTIDLDEKELIHNVFEFDNKTAEEVMTHRTSVEMLWLEEDDETWEKIIFENRHSIYPICGDSSDDIVGILRTKDYFMLKNRDRATVLEKAVRPAQFVPETVRTDLLFQNMKKNRDHFAIVLDEHGGMSGVITINDLLEQLVGDLEDDDSIPVDAPLIEQIEENSWLISGSASIEKVSIETGVHLPEEYETFAGMVFGLLGRVPKDGQTPELCEFNLVIKVIEVKEHRLEKAVVCLLKDSQKKETEKEKDKFFKD